MALIIVIVVLVIAVFVAASSIRTAFQYERAVVFRLGELVGARGPGLYFLIPLLETQQKIDLRTITDEVEPQEVITSDNVPIKVEGVIWYRIVDPIKACIEVKSYDQAITQVALTSLRMVIGKHRLDDVLRGQDTLSGVLRTDIDQATEAWGVRIERFEMKNIEIPASMQRAMAQEAEAEREKRARIIKAQAELEASEKLQQAAAKIMEVPAGLELRRMQMITEVGAEQNTTTIVMMPSEFVTMAGRISEKIEREAASKQS
jgi:regulator of protease activity HflC (stomatin/prohibitin superfamily)